MREWCSCGAAVRSRSYARVLDWRYNHRCSTNSPSGAESDTERADVDEEGMVARIGFRPNA